MGVVLRRRHQRCGTWRRRDAGAGPVIRRLGVAMGIWTAMTMRRHGIVGGIRWGGRRGRQMVIIHALLIAARRHGNKPGGGAPEETGRPGRLASFDGAGHNAGGMQAA